MDDSSEFDIIKTYFSNGFADNENIVLGPGDDCAVIDPPNGTRLCISLDTMVEGVHFPVNTAADLIGYRALAAAVSDLAAMGAEPMAFTLGLTVRDVPRQWFADLSRGLHEASSLFGISLIGGDLTTGPLSLAVQVTGVIPKDQMLSRQGASLGDHIFVTGTLGDADLGLQLLEGRLQSGHRDYLVDRYFKPSPRIAEGKSLLGIASAAIDISDGLLADLGHLVAASGAGAEIAMDALPTSVAYDDTVAPEDHPDTALTRGDDYELCFTAPMTASDELALVAGSWDCRMSRIGTIVAGSKVVCRGSDGEEIAMTSRGYHHRLTRPE